jgi:hypothetical protein
MSRLTNTPPQGCSPLNGYRSQRPNRETPGILAKMSWAAVQSPWKNSPPKLCSCLFASSLNACSTTSAALRPSYGSDVTCIDHLPRAAGGKPALSSESRRFTSFEIPIFSSTDLSNCGLGCPRSAKPSPSKRAR